MVGAWVSGIAAVLVAVVVGLAAQGSPPSTHAAAGTQVFSGCVEAAPDGRGFVLANARPVTGASSRTSAAAGTSAIGDAPTGSISGDTPTGSTATTEAAPLPKAGEPAASASPASPTYNRGASGAEGTSGSGPESSTPAANAPARRLRLVPQGTIDLAAHRGHRVEVRGTLATRASTTDGVSRQAELPTFAVTAVTHRAATCAP